ncbi:unnamed protein product [Hydatigera taeniaeformis]|uniref:Nucleoporin NSP1-like C-terminal domain-containing protein n=1 Tax=Hydatigena taeniaeformis TaxID=6205 RepID=A0A3P7FDR1_HYDTA|nr:unnamed protein product [Hydatigera taeniaeformis]
MSFGGFGLAKPGTTTTPATTSTTATAVTTSGFSLSSLIKPSESTAPTTSAVTSAAAVTTASTTTSAVTATTTTTTGSSGAALPSAATSLTYRQLEDMVNKWTYELDEQSRNFSAELNRLNKADGVLIANAEKISDLHAKVEACKAGQSRIEQVSFNSAKRFGRLKHQHTHDYTIWCSLALSRICGVVHRIR